MATRTLEMVFANASGRSVTLRLTGAKADLTGEQVGATMDLIVDKNIFTSSGGDLVSPIQARVVTRDVEMLEIE